MSTLNTYGDKLISTSGTHGSDISSQRMDDLDMAVLEYALTNYHREISGLDIGCGFGIHSIRLALMQVKMMLMDILPIEAQLSQIADLLMIKDKLCYYRMDARDLSSSDAQNLDFVYSQRFIHYLSYQEAQNLIKDIHDRLKPNGKLFISASGLNSELGQGYHDREVAIAERFSQLDAAMAEKHDIHNTVCLYTERELTDLMTSCSFQEDRVWTSAFGNIKGIYTKRE